MIIKILALILILIGVIFVYDARILSNNWFSFGDQNEATSRIKNTWFHFGYNWINNCIYIKMKNKKKLLIKNFNLYIIQIIKSMEGTNEK